MESHESLLQCMHACMQMYAAHQLFADEMKALLAMSSFLLSLIHI